MRNSHRRWGYGNRGWFQVGFKVVSLFIWAHGFLWHYMDGHPQASVVLFPCSLSQGFKEATMGITFLYHLFLSIFLLHSVKQEGEYGMIDLYFLWPEMRLIWHDGSLSSVARDEAHMARDESCITGGEADMTRDYCQPEESIHRCVRTHSHLYSYMYGLLALIDNIQSIFSKDHIFEQ